MESILQQRYGSCRTHVLMHCLCATRAINWAEDGLWQRGTDFDPEKIAVFGCHTSPPERMPFSVLVKGDAAENRFDLVSSCPKTGTSLFGCLFIFIANPIEPGRRTI